MKKNKPFTKKVIMKSKLKHYSALAASVVALDASAQVVYTNINDTTLVNNGDYFDIDLNNDGIKEGRIEFINSSSSLINLKGAEVDSLVNASINIINSSYGTSTSSSTYVAAALSLNSNINNNLNRWASAAPTSTNSSAFNGFLIGAKRTLNTTSTTSTISIGQFPGVGDKFLGVKFTIGTSTHYGWLRLDMSANADSITVKDFAYQATPNAAILAGDTGTAVGLSQRNRKDKLDYFAANGRIKINSELTSNSTLSIFDLSGKLLQSELISTQKEISIQGNLQGIYIVEIRNSTGVTRKKLWLESN